MVLHLIQVHNFHCQMINGVVILQVDNSSFVHGDNRKKITLVLGAGTADELDDDTIRG